MTLTKIPKDLFNDSKVINYNNMFKSCKSLYPANYYLKINRKKKLKRIYEAKD